MKRKIELLLAAFLLSSCQAMASVGHQRIQKPKYTEWVEICFVYEDGKVTEQACPEDPEAEGKG